MSEEKSDDAGKLIPQYQTYERQKCFIAYTEQATWSADLLSACQEVLSQPRFNLEPDYARKHFDPDIPLRQKALELIANARHGIYDLSYWRTDENSPWQMPRNVFIELGMAIALNRPTLLLRHAKNRELELAECLKSVSGHILEFSGEITLKQALEKRLRQWVNVPPERDWWSRYCIFGDRRCEYRGAHPRARQWGQKTLRCHISDGTDVDRDDFRGVVEEVLGRFSDVTFDYLDALPLAEGYNFLLCAQCQTVRSTPFAIYRITPHTPSETFIVIGMSIALEEQFEYKIPKILLTENAQDVPSLLSGYEVFVAQSDTDRKTHLRTFMPTVMQKVRETAWRPKPLPFIEVRLTPAEELWARPSSRVSRSIKRLANLMRARQDNAESPYVLILGAGASLTSGASSFGKVIESVVNDYSRQDPSDMSWDGKVGEFYNILDDFSESERYAIIKKHIEGQRPSAGYHALAQLAKEGYFDVIFSTNYDTFVEDAFADAGFRVRDLTVLINGQDTEEGIIKALSYPNPRSKLVKLHGDLGARIYAFTPEEIFQFSDKVERVLTDYLSRDVMICGHSMRDDDIARCLRETGGALWYVNPSAPTAADFIWRAMRVRRGIAIDGEDGYFDNFFCALRDELVGAPATKQESPPIRPK